MLGLAESGHWDKVADMVANFGYEIVLGAYSQRQPYLPT